MGRARYSKLTNRHKLSARSLKVVRDAMVGAVRSFQDSGTVKFRGRALGNEAYINAAVWSLAERPMDEQERVLRRYLARLETYLIDDDPPESGGADAGAGVARTRVNRGDNSGPARRRGAG